MGSERSPFLDRIRLQRLDAATGFVPNLSIKTFYLGELSYIMVGSEVMQNRKVLFTTADLNLRKLESIMFIDV